VSERDPVGQKAALAKGRSPLFRGYLSLGLNNGVHSSAPVLLTRSVAAIIKDNSERLLVPAC
jgi:hypothetical protein